jgi:hypothetical protein
MHIFLGKFYWMGRYLGTFSSDSGAQEQCTVFSNLEMKYGVGNTNWSKIKKEQSLGDHEINDGDSMQIVFPSRLFLILVI